MKHQKINKLFLLSLLTIGSLTSCNGNNQISKFTFNYSSATTKDYSNSVFYNDDYFSNPSTTYNPSLATTSLCLAMSSFGSNVKKNNSDYSYRYRNVEGIFTSFGFSSFEKNEDFTKKPGTDTLGAFYAKKKIGDDTVIGVGVRGANYEQEWASNVTLGKESDNPCHQGFYQAATIALDGLKNYINSQDIQGNIKIWIAGYSRAGATTNIASGILDKAIKDNVNYLSDKVTYTKEDIYAYTFEAPQGAYYDSSLDYVEVKGADYSNIFNIVNNNDAVPMVAMNVFGFTRYGNDVYVTNPLSDVNYSSNIEKVKGMYSKIENYIALGEKYLVSDFTYKSIGMSEGHIIPISQDGNHINWPQGLFLNEFVTTLADKGVLTRDRYVEEFQDGLRSIFNIVYKNGLPSGSFVQFGLSLVNAILKGDEQEILMDDILHNRSHFVDDLVPLLTRALLECDIDITVKQLVSDIKSLLLAIVDVFFVNPSLIISLVSSNNIKAIASAHYPELCLAHMQARDPNYTSNYITSDMSGRYYKFTSSNIDSSITISKNNREVCKLDQGVIVDTGSDLVYAIDNNQFVAYLPLDKGYTINMSVEAKGSLDIYEPSKIRYIQVAEDIDNQTSNTQIDSNVKIEFNL